MGRLNWFGLLKGLGPFAAFEIEEWNFNKAKEGERTMKSFLLFLELVGYGAGTAQWLRQEEKTKKKWLNEWVSPACGDWLIYLLSALFLWWVNGAGTAQWLRQRERTEQESKWSNQQSKKGKTSSAALLCGSSWINQLVGLFMNGAKRRRASGPFNSTHQFSLISFMKLMLNWLRIELGWVDW